MRGKGFVDEGTGGCVFRPHIQCSAQVPTSKNTVGKVFEDDHYASELKQFQKIKSKIDPNNTFTVELFGACKVSHGDFKKSDEKEKCSKIGPDYRQIIFGNGGEDLSKLAYTLVLDDIVPHMRNLFYGICQIKNAQYAHFDIKPANLLFDKNTNRFNIVDFGLMTSLDNIYKPGKEYMLMFNYQWYPPEMKCWCMLNRNAFDKYETVIATINQNFRTIPLYDIFQHFPNNEMHLNAFYLFCKAHPKKGLAVIEKNVHKIDVYSLGTTMYHLLRVCAELGNYRSTVLVKQMFDLCKKMICFDPRKRLSPEQALVEYDKIVANLSNKRYNK